MKLGLLTAAFPDLIARGDRRLGGRERLRDARDRVLARRRGASAPLRRRLPHRRRVASTPMAVHDVAGEPRARRSPRSPTTRTTCTPTTSTREAANAHLRKVIDAAQRARRRTVGTFVGNDKDRPYPENLERFREIWPRARRSRGRARRADRDRELPDDLQLRRVARRQQPRLRRRRSGARCSRRSPDENFGLNFDPSHLVWQMIDYERAVYEFGDASSTCTPRTSRCAATGCTSTA